MPRTDWSDVDPLLLDPLWHAKNQYHDVFRQLRDEDPIHWTEDTAFGRNYWSLTRYDHVKEMLDRDRDFSSRWDMRAPRSPIRRTPEQRFAENLDSSMSLMDRPVHDAYRRPLNKHFTVPMVGKMRQQVVEYVDQIVGEVAEKGQCDLVNDVAAELPARLILGWLNVPKQDWEMLKYWVWLFIAPSDPRFTIDNDPIATSWTGMSQILDYAEKLCDERRVNPGDDLVTILVNTHIDGTPASNHELRSYMKTMIAAGLETTRNAAVVGLWRFMLDPEQRQLLVDNPDWIGPAVEEVLRWVTPSKNRMRLVNEDMDFHGKRLRGGDWIFGWTASSNKDERVYPDPHRFDIRRDASNHLSMGSGIHACLGRHLAKLELSVLIPKVLATFPDMRPTSSGEPDWIADQTITGFRSMEVEYTPVAAHA